MRLGLRWTAGFLAFPVAGPAGRAVVGPVDDAVSALAGGVMTGAVICAGQALVSSGRLSLPRWSTATAAGSGLGLLLGASPAGRRTDLGSLALMGAVEGVLLGAARTRALPGRRPSTVALGRRRCRPVGGGPDGDHPDASGRVWHLPSDPHTRTPAPPASSPARPTAPPAGPAHRATGRPGAARLRRMPTAALYAMGAFNRTVRELIEMRYEFAEPFVVDSTLIRDRLGAVATPVEEALDRTVAACRASRVTAPRK
ncbi:hypothetical protein EDD98_4540 [Streptomyces sp. PanSC19]|nr:hypothetical protein EDD98_4540 [Streptomyces sp. PanSC19]